MANGELAAGLATVFRGGGEGMVCMFLCQPCGGGLQTNRVLLFDSVHPAPFRNLARTFPSRVYRPRITTSPRLFRVHSPRASSDRTDPFGLLIAINHVSTRDSSSIPEKLTFGLFLFFFIYLFEQCINLTTSRLRSFGFVSNGIEMKCCLQQKGQSS